VTDGVTQANVNAVYDALSLRPGQHARPRAGTDDRVLRYGVKGAMRYCVVARGAKCVSARLRYRVTHHGDLRGADLRTSWMWFTTFTGTNLSGADMSGASVGAPMYSQSAPPVFTAGTICPSGMTLAGADFGAMLDSMPLSLCGFGLLDPTPTG
jgi:hypothetical protein